jgi:hypothetical protein
MHQNNRRILRSTYSPSARTRGRPGTILFLSLLAAVAGFGQTGPGAAQTGSGVAATPAFHPIDLSGHAKGWDQFNPGECWTVVPRGLQQLEGVPFQMDGTLEITGMGSARDLRGFYPTRITGIPIGHKGHRLHLITGAGYNAPDGTPIAKLLAHYADGSDQAFYLRYGVHTRNWWRERAEMDDRVSDPDTAVAWSYTQPPFNLRLYKTTLQNPHPDREIKSLDLLSLLSRATPVVVAITLEEDPGAPAPKASASPDVDESACRRELLLRFVDKDGQPVPGAVAKLTLTDEGRTFPYGTNVADAAGKAIVDYPANQVRELAIEVRSSAGLPARISLANAEPGNLPLEQKIKLEPGVTLGGLVRDTTGQPIARARVSVNTVVRDEVGQSIEAETDVATTDQSGRWSSRSVSADFKSLTFKLTHPEFRPAEYYISDSGPGASQEGSKADLLAGKAIMVMEPGTTLAGTVTNPTGKPLANADVFLRDASDPPRDRFATTDSSGHFKLVFMDAGQGVLAVAAKGYSPQSINVPFDSGLKQVTFKLQPAKPLKGIVLGQDRKPVAGATVDLVSWNDLPFPRWQTQTDAKGGFSWDSAPADGALLSVRMDGYLTEGQSLAPGDEDVTIVLNPLEQIVGKVIDADTKEPIPEFQVILGRVFSGDDVLNWERYNPLRATGGKYSFPTGQNPSGAGFRPASVVTVSQGGARTVQGLQGARIRLLVEAPGYLPQASPTLSVSGWLTNDFELRKGNGPKGILKLPNGQPAADVTVTLLTGDFTQLKDAHLESRGSASSIVTSDAEGKFALPAGYATSLVAAGSEGYAEAPLERLDTTLTLTLQPWGRIEGVVRNGPNPATNEWVMVTMAQGRAGLGLQFDFDTYRTQADDQGRFVLNNVPPGERLLTRLIPMQFQNNRGWMFSHGQTITVKAGETTRIDFGGKGRTVIGKVVPNERRDITWQSGRHFLRTPQPRPPSGSFSSLEEARAWENTPEVKEARARARNYAVQFSDDGSFRIEDVLPGKYELNLTFNEPGSQSFLNGAYVGSVHQEVEVGEIPAGQPGQPVDLGRLDLVVQSQPALINR